MEQLHEKKGIEGGTKKNVGNTVKKGKEKLAAGIIAVAGICWGIIGIFSRNLASVGFSPVQVTLGRCLFTALIFIIVLAISNPKLLKINPKDIWMFFLTGICSIVFFNIFNFTAIQLTSLSTASILLYTAPIIVTIMSVFLFKEKFTTKKAISLVLAFGGCVLVSGIGGGDVNVLGILAGFGAGFGYALYSIFGRFALAKYEPATVTAWTFLVATFGLIWFSNPSQMISLAQANPIPASNMLLMAAISTAIPFALYTKALTMMEAGKASIIASVEPVTSTLTGIIVFNESLTLMSSTGVLLILIAIILLNMKEKIRSNIA